MLEEEITLEDKVTLAAGPGGPGGPLDPGPGGPGGPGGFLDARADAVDVEEEGVKRILVDWGKDFIRLLGSFSPALNCKADVGEGESGMWVILIDEASVLVMLGSRISISGPPGNLDFVTVLTVGLSLTILACVGLLVKLMVEEEEEEEVIEKGEDVLVKILVFGALGEGAIVNFERCDIPSGPTPLDAELLIL